MTDEKIDVTNPPEKMRSWWWLNILLIGCVFLLVGLGIGLYFAKTKQVLDSVYQMQIQIQSAQQINQEIATTLNDLQRNVQNQAFQFHQQQLALKRATWRAQQTQWQLGEIRYLVNLANSSLVFAQDVKTSYQLLDQVHQNILMAHNPSFDALDQAVQSDMQMLAQAKLQDATQIFLQIAELNQVVANMPLLGSQFVKEPVVDKTVAPVATTWKDYVQRAWKELRFFLVIRKTSDPLLPLMTQEEGGYIKQYISLQLGQAQWAVQRHNPDVYQASLKQALIWVRQSFVAQSPMTQQVVAGIEKLQQIDIQFPNVTLKKTMDALSAISTT